MSKGVDRTFMHYGVRQDDMSIIENACMDNDIDAEWMKEFILKEYHLQRNNQEPVEDKKAEDKKLTKLLNKALKQI